MKQTLLTINFTQCQLKTTTSSGSISPCNYTNPVSQQFNWKNVYSWPCTHVRKTTFCPVFQEDFYHHTITENHDLSLTSVKSYKHNFVTVFPTLTKVLLLPQPNQRLDAKLDVGVTVLDFINVVPFKEMLCKH